MITPSFGLTATERVLPKLALDWTTGLAQPGVDVTRAGVATFVGSNGFIQSATADTQRIDWSTGTAGLLVEEQRTNLFTRSEEFGTSPWTQLRCSISANSIIAPDGTLTADKLVENTDNDSHRLYRTYNTYAAVAHTMSVYAKAGERDWIAITADLPNTFAWFDLNTGVVGTVQANVSSAIITAVGNGWYRCSVTFTGISILANPSIYNANADNSIFYTGDGYSGIYIWGAQLEVGAFPTSYIPTTTTAATRNADVATMTGVGSVNQGTFTVDATYVNGSTLITSGGVSFDATASTAQKTAVGYDATSIKRSINAGAVSSDAGTTAGADIAFGTGGVIRKLSLYSIKMIDAELQAFSKE